MVEKVIFALPDLSYENHTWTLQDEHNPASHPPLIASASPMSRSVDGDQQDKIPATLNINGFNYAREADSQIGARNPFGETLEPETVEDLTKWRREWLPQVEDLKIMLENFDPDAVKPGEWAKTLQYHDEEYRRVFSGIHRNAVGPSRSAVYKFLNAYTEQYGENNRAKAMALLHGFPNLSLDRACALWDLSRIMRSDSSLRGLKDIDELVASTPSSIRFRREFHKMLDVFGITSNNGLQDLPTWIEGSPIPLSIIRSYATQEDSKSPKEASLNQRKIRLSIETELRNPSKHTPVTEKLLHLMEMAQQLTPNLEDHNLLCDQQCVYSSRRRWLNIGTYLVNKGLLAINGSVFFYRRSELLEALDGGSSITEEELNRRSDLQNEYRTMPPPLHLGLPPKNIQETVSVPMPGTVAQEGITQRMLKGIAASPGNHRGIARVFQSIDEASSLEEGEVLVLRALTPPWTPYIAVAGAIVTNSGGALSHGAVVAREFGVPAVVGTVNGTNLIPDRSVVSVDGTNGMVVIEKE